MPLYEVKYLVVFTLAASSDGDAGRKILGWAANRNISIENLSFVQTSPGMFEVRAVGSRMQTGASLVASVTDGESGFTGIPPGVTLKSLKAVEARDPSYEN